MSSYKKITIDLLPAHYAVSDTLTITMRRGAKTHKAWTLTSWAGDRAKGIRGTTDDCRKFAVSKIQDAITHLTKGEKESGCVLCQAKADDLRLALSKFHH